MRRVVKNRLSLKTENEINKHRTEKAIQDAMQLIMKNRTSIVIAHRLSTIRDADMIVVMDQRRIVEQGSHEELLAQKGRYYELYMTQYAGFAI